MKSIMDILADPNTSELLIVERENKNIVIGVPHHAPAGQSELPCPVHKNSDENAGYLGYYIARKVDCCCIIACNYHLDVNKCLSSDYAVHIARWNPKFLIEIHGHGVVNGNFNIEISSGSAEENENSKKLVALLKKKCETNSKLKLLSISGDFSEIHFKATNSVTITDKRWISLHIELPPELRCTKRQKGGEPPQKGYVFCDYLIESLKEMLLFK